MVGPVLVDATQAEGFTDTRRRQVERLQDPQHRRASKTQGSLGQMEVGQERTGLLSHRRAAADCMKPDVSVVADHAGRRYLDNPGLTITPTGGHDGSRRRTAAFFARPVGNEGVVVMAQDRKDLFLLSLGS